MNLANQKVVIIGGSSGIGLVIAKLVIAAGGNPIIASRSATKLQQTQGELGEKATTEVLDITIEADIERFFEQIGTFDHLVITAFLGITGAFLQLETEQAKQVFEHKFWGQYYAAKYAAKHLNPQGSMVLFSGSAAHKPVANLSAIAAANGAIEALARSLAVELAPIRVNVVSPGLVATPTYDAIPEAQRQGYFDYVANSLPVKRIGQPEDIAQLVLSLMQNQFITGTVVDINGGAFLV